MKLVFLCLLVYVVTWPCRSENASPFLRIFKRHAKELFQDEMQHLRNNYQMRTLQDEHENPNQYELESVPIRESRVEEGKVKEPQLKSGLVDPNSIVPKAMQFQTKFRVDFDWIISTFTQFLLMFFPTLGRIVQRFHVVLVEIARVIWDIVVQSLYCIWNSVKNAIFRINPLAASFRSALGSITSNFLGHGRFKRDLVALTGLNSAKMRYRRDTMEFVTNLMSNLQNVLQNDFLAKTLIRTAINIVPGFAESYPELMTELEFVKGPVRIVIFMIEAFVKFLILKILEKVPKLSAITEIMLMIWNNSKQTLMPFIEKGNQYLGKWFKEFMHVFAQSVQDIPHPITPQ